MDADGGVWVALWTGGAVHRYHSDGTLDQVLELPVEKVTCCTFGGSDFRDLYITTAATGLDEAGRARQPHAGSVFACRARGLWACPRTAPTPDDRGSRDLPR